MTNSAHKRSTGQGCLLYGTASQHGNGAGAPEKESQVSIRTCMALSCLLATVTAMGVPTASVAQSPGGGAPGTVVGSMPFGGFQRTYLLHVPRGHERSRPLPLVLALHGGGGAGRHMEQLTAGRLNQLAERDGFAVVYPDGVDRHWNDGRGVPSYRAHRDNIDDVSFIAALIDHLSAGTHIDRGRVYATGISNGGLMSLRLARELSAKITAIAVVAVNSSEQIARMRDPSRPLSVLLMPGTRDPLVPWGGGDIGFPGGQKVGRVLSVQETLGYWVAHNQCPPSPAVAWEPDRAPGDWTRVRREAYGPCREGTEVVLYAVEGGGHTWPGGFQYLPDRVIGRTSRDIDASDVIWEFFRRHAIR